MLDKLVNENRAIKTELDYSPKVVLPIAFFLSRVPCNTIVWHIILPLCYHCRSHFKFVSIRSSRIGSSGEGEYCDGNDITVLFEAERHTVLPAAEPENHAI
jgi:hypothetical protein